MAEQTELNSNKPDFVASANTMGQAITMLSPEARAARRSEGGEYNPAYTSNYNGMVNGDAAIYAGLAAAPDSGGGNESPWSPYSIYGGGSGGGGGSNTPNQKALAVFNLGNIKDNFKNMMDAYDEADRMNSELADVQRRNAEASSSQEWFSRLVNLAQTAANLGNRIGTGHYGSTNLDLVSKLNQVNDAQSTEVLEALGQTMMDIGVDLGYSEAGTANARNELAANTVNAERNLAGQHLSDLSYSGDADEYIDGDNKSVTIPEYLDVDTYENIKPEAKVFDFVSQLFRPDAAREATMGGTKATLEDMYNDAMQSIKPNASAAANSKYWNTMTRDYGHRLRSS